MTDLPVIRTSGTYRTRPATTTAQVRFPSGSRVASWSGSVPRKRAQVAIPDGRREWHQGEQQTLATTSGAAPAVDVADVQRQGTVTVRSSKTDQEGRWNVRYLGAPTMQRLAAWLSAAVDAFIVRTLCRVSD